MASTSALRVLTVCVAVLVALSAPVAAGAGQGDCSQPQTDGVKPVASDCLAVLQAAVKLTQCPLCVCDTDGSGSIVATDALLCLKYSVGAPVSLACDPCQVSTTTSTTLLGTPSSSTTSSSTSSTSTTLPAKCTSNTDCEGQPGFRCNPNSSNCEPPCYQDDDCNLFYECDLGTNYCVLPD